VRVTRQSVLTHSPDPRGHRFRVLCYPANMVNVKIAVAQQKQQLKANFYGSEKTGNTKQGTVSVLPGFWATNERSGAKLMFGPSQYV